MRIFLSAGYSSRPSLPRNGRDRSTWILHDPEGPGSRYDGLLRGVQEMDDTFLRSNYWHAETVGFGLLDYPTCQSGVQLGMVSALKQIKVNASLGKGKDAGIRCIPLYWFHQDSLVKVELFEL